VLNDYGMYQGYNVEGNVDLSVNPTSQAAPMTGVSCPTSVGMNASMGACMPQVYEPMQERQIHRNILHEVPHVCPVNTRIINHHIYRHTYSPCYTCCEENIVCNVQEGSCCNY
jgi:hypothetical protein